jgi:hypothetical protein
MIELNEMKCVCCCCCCCCCCWWWWQVTTNKTPIFVDETWSCRCGF